MTMAEYLRSVRTTTEETVRVVTLARESQDLTASERAAITRKASS